MYALCRGAFDQPGLYSSCLKGFAMRKVKLLVALVMKRIAE